MSLQGWFNTFEALSFISAATVIIGLVLEYGKDLFTVVAFWKPGPHIAEIEVETFKKKRGSVLVVAGIFLELIATGGIAVTSDRIETQHRGEIAALEKRLGDEQSARLESQYLMERSKQGRHIKVMQGYVNMLPEEGEFSSEVLIQNVDDPDADRLACELDYVLNRIWKGRRVDMGTTHIEDAQIFDGVEILCEGCDAKSESVTARDARKLREFFVSWPNLIAAEVGDLSEVITNAVPKGGILILIGKHSIDVDMAELKDFITPYSVIERNQEKLSPRYRTQLVSGCLPPK